MPTGTPPVVVRFQLEDPEEIDILLGLVQSWNEQRMRRLARRGKPLPHPYAPSAGIVYRREDPTIFEERLLTAEEVVAEGGGDCEDLSPYLAAWLKVNQSIPAKAVSHESSVGYHCIVKTPSGIMDPSKKLGMK